MGRNLFPEYSKKINKPAQQRAGRNLFANEQPQEETNIGRDVLAGLAQGGHELLNTPYELAKNIEQQGQHFGEMTKDYFPIEQYVSKQINNSGNSLHDEVEQFNKKNNVPDSLKNTSWNSPISSRIPHQEEHHFAQELGQKGEGTFWDNAIQGGAHYTPEILLGLNALKSVLPHLTKRGATKKLNQAQQTFKNWAENETSSSKNNGKLNVNPELIEDTRQFLPNTLDERHLLNEAANDYDKLFKLQSEVGKISAKRTGKFSSIFAPESRIKGEAGLASRRKLINAMHENLQSEGLHDVSNLFREGQNDFRRYMKFKPYRNAIALSGLVAAGNAIFPKNPLTDLVKKLYHLSH